MIKILWFVDIVERYRILKCRCSYISFPTSLYRVQNILCLSHFPYFPSWFIMQIPYFVNRKRTSEYVLLLLLLLILVRIFSRFIVGSSTRVLHVLDSALDTIGSTVPPCSYFPFFPTDAIWNWLIAFLEGHYWCCCFFYLYSLYTMVSMLFLFCLVLIMLHFSWHANS
jgi:hypothetical protein